MENYYSRIKELISQSVGKSAKVILLSCLMGFSALGVYAQGRTISGTVTSSDDGSTLPGVTLIIKGTTTGTVADIDGNFKLEVPSDDAILVASFVGYESMEQAIGTRSVIDFALNIDVETLDEVVVVGYGTQKKSDLTGAVASVTGENLRGTITASVDQALQGRIAGVQVTQNSGQPGGAVSIRVRGTTSLTQSSEPLYVIDGIQIGGDADGSIGFAFAGGSNGQADATSNPLASINPSDIESIEVLKDASATAIYGSRAANGVVIITTKRGKSGDATVSYNGFYALQQVAKTYDMMDLPAYARYNNEVANEVSGVNSNQRFADPSLLGPGTDWQDAIYRVAPMQSHSITVTGGSDNTTYMVSGGYFKQDGIILGSNFDRFNTRLNIDSRVREGVNVGASISFSTKSEDITSQDGGDGVVSQALQMPPHVPVRDFNGEFAGPTQGNGSDLIGSNPVGLALLRNNTVNNQRIMANLFADVEIIDGLKVRSEIAFDNGHSLNKAFQPTYQWGDIGNPVSILGQRQQSNFFWLWKTYGTYTRSFGDHSLTGMIGTEAQRGSYEGFVTYKVNLPNDIPVLSQGDNATQLTNGWSGWNTLNSYFARVNYNFNDRYLVTGTVRRDGSSRFGPNKRWGLFPSASVAWRVSNEGFLAASDVVSNLKLRVGWGKVGNQEIDNYAFGSGLATVNSAFGTGARNDAYSNPDVQWESSTMTNVGLDVSLWQGRFDVSVDAYNKVTDDLLLRVNLPATFGDQVNGPLANVGSMENKGIEVALNTVNLDMGKFKWTTSINYSMNRNEVTQMQGADLYEALNWYQGFGTTVKTSVGNPVGQFYGYVVEGIFTSKEELLSSPVQIPDDVDATINKIDRTTGLWLGDLKYKDLNNDNVIDSEDQTEVGDPNPDFTFGFNNTFTYGPFVLDVFLTGSIGGDIMNYSRARNESMNSNFNNQSTTVNNRARTELIDPNGSANDIDNVQLINPGTDIPRFDNGGENHNHHMSSRWIEDGSYVRVQNIKLSYTLPAALTQKARLSKVLFYVNVQNPFTFTNYSGLDPQIGAFNQNPIMLNVDMGRYPTPRIYTGGVSVNF